MRTLKRFSKNRNQPNQRIQIKQNQYCRHRKIEEIKENSEQDSWCNAARQQTANCCPAMQHIKADLNVFMGSMFIFISSNLHTGSLKDPGYHIWRFWKTFWISSLFHPPPPEFASELQRPGPPNLDPSSTFTCLLEDASVHSKYQMHLLTSRHYAEVLWMQYFNLLPI